MRRSRISLVAALLLATALAAPIVPTASAAPFGSGTSGFGRMFPAAPTVFAQATAQDLADLAQTQLDPNADADNNPAGLGSGFTYLGQFIDHDLTLDTSSSPTATVDLTTLVNSRHFAFDLDSVYGDGPAESPQLYAADGKHFLIQEPNGNGVRDLPRNPDGSAILVEKRNDENQIISQIHVAFLKFHNAMVDRGMSYGQAHDTTVGAYRFIVRNEFLPHIVSQDVIDAVSKKGKRGYYDPGSKKYPMTPVEFSVAAYRFGHSQVRRAYRLSGAGNCANLQVFNLANPTDSLMGGRPLQAGRQIVWGQFFPTLPQPPECAALPVIPPGASRNVSRKIDPLISSSLFALPIPGAEATGSNVLAFRNLMRSKFYDLPSGQQVAQAMGVTPIPAAELQQVGTVFSTDTPLWYYILAEGSRSSDGAKLGPVGGRIVAEVILDVLGKFTSTLPPGAGPDFSMADFLVMAGVA